MRTFLDTGVLLTAARGVDRDRELALGLLEDSERIFLTSPFIQLELIPKAVFHKQVLEEQFYRMYFRSAESLRNLEKIEALAQREASVSGLAAMDALHLAAAHIGRAEEFVTTERPGKPVYRSSLVRVVYLFDPGR